MDILFKTILDLIYPPTCIGCGKFGVVFCDYCLDKIEFSDIKKCVVCQRPSVKGFTHQGCLKPYTPERLITPFKYQGVIRRGVLSGKYGPKTFYIFEKLVETAFQYLHEIGFNLGDEALVIPVPLHKNRQSFRGFNQSDIIADVLASKFGLKVNKNSLIRIKGADTQTKFNKKERLKNVSGAFLCKDGSVRGKDVLLVDDVCTTGATFLASAKALKKAGARFVWCFALASA